jgi:hypothetical protein
MFAPMLGRWLRLLPVAALGGGLLAAQPAAAAPPGQVVVFEEHVINEPTSEVAPFPCLGGPGMEDDEALITSLETRHVVVTAAGIDEAGEPIAPLTVRATFHERATINPLAEALPTYTGSSFTVFRQRIGETGRHDIVVGLFKAAPADDSDRLRFTFRYHLVVSPDGTVRVDRTVAGCGH